MRLRDVAHAEFIQGDDGGIQLETWPTRLYWMPPGRPAEATVAHRLHFLPLSLEELNEASFGTNTSLMTLMAMKMPTQSQKPGC